MKHKPYRQLFYFLLLVVQKFFSFLPYSFGFSFGGSVGKFIFLVLPKERRKTISHLRMAFGSEKSESELKKIAQSVFEHYGKMMAEWLLIDKLIARFDDYVSAEGYENFDKALAKQKGVVVTIAHFGNWEIMGGYTALRGYPCTVIARRIYFDKYDRYLVNLRKKMKVETIYRDDSVRNMLGTLKKNRMLGFVVDQDVDTVEGVFVDFFNRPAFTPVAPVRFALASGAAIVPVFIVREGMKHRMIVEKEIPLIETGNKEENIRVNTQRWVAIQEKYIRQYPHLWVWNHRRWKTSPGISRPKI